ncbi:hypothetical protein QR680_008439 [Steinernema hermaphroditum]|uniref:Glutamate-gated chloride channel n=1 Tax=Steinernema hermaphroditum TaxID=289476 RepID=A0AA39IIK0_9BILA|nr:hypothetical protein QR680_008439 [Steinernema hermaphroditum]
MLQCGLILALLYFTVAAVRINESYSDANQEQLILERLLSGYDARIRPPPSDSSQMYGPVIVKVNIMIRMLSKIDVVNMEYGMQITFREQWLDKRLAFDHLGYVNPPKFLTVPYVKNNVWIPDSFFPTEKAAHRHMIDTENMFLRIHPDGTVLYSVRLSLTLSCPMHLQLYPLDVQNCDFDLISYAHTTRDIVYQWDSNPVQLKKGVGNDLPNFLLTGIETHHECTSHTNTGSYACLRMRLKLSRQFSYYLIQVYGPTTIIVIVSWISFWIDMHSTAGRVALGVTTLLTMTTLQSALNSKLPPVSYIKVVDVWIGACQTFVFGALIEYAFVSYQDTLLKSTKLNKTKIRKSQKRVERLELLEVDFYQPPCTCSSRSCNPDLVPKIPWKYRMRKWFKKPSYLPAQIDFYARFCAPIGFICFNIVYWSSCWIMTARVDYDA